jgi:FtsP/CotA-like multicopper oxidase with cupredoxin domain
MTWVPERPGNWLFHCHLPEHFGARGPLGMILPVADDHMAGHQGSHAQHAMSGLVMGIQVRPSPLSPIVRRTADDAPRRSLRLLVRPSVGGSDASPLYAFALQSGAAAPPPDSGTRVGPPIVLQRGEPVRITVVNALAVPTAVHWHGIELESYYDGVPGFSGDGQRLTPMIAPGDSFEVRFTPPRAGTFIYHTHADEERQQLAGLAGPIVVLEPGARFDPATDIPVMISTPRDWDDELKSVLLDGSLSPAPRTLRAGVAYRFRFVNMTMRRPNVGVVLLRDSTPVAWRLVAKDGADLPSSQRVSRPGRQPISIGETMDLEFVPAAPGEMRIEVRGATGALLGTMPLRVVAGGG